MMSSVLLGRLLPFLLLGAGFSGCTAFGIDPVFSDLTKIFGDVCGLPLGFDIPDEHITASSNLPGNEPYVSRFNLGLAGWRVEFNDSDQWIQIRLPSKIPVTAILTQGSPDQDFYVTRYKVDYSLDAEHWSCLLDMHSQPKIFEGNTDNSTPKINDFRPAVEANYIRIKPVKWHDAIAMRLEVFGGGCPECWEK